MGKRQQRIFKQDFFKQISMLVGKEANILLTNQSTLHGIILKADSKEIHLRDLRHKNHIFQLEDVEEIMLDRETTY